jgi:polysaccharide pyruvyl transferase WcaK-like protein
VVHVRKKPSSIAILGAFGQQNLGNECTLQAFLCSCRKYLSGVQIKCICTVPEETAARYNVRAFPMSAGYSQVWPGLKNPALRLARKIFVYLPREVIHWFKAFRALGNTEALFVPGTGILTDAHQTSFGFPYHIFMWSVIATLRRCKVVYVSVGAGPIDRPLSRWFIKSALSRAAFRSFRDSPSKECLTAIGFPANNDPLYPDLVFNMPLPKMARNDNGKRSRRRIAIGIMSYIGKPGSDKSNYALDTKYLEKIAAFVTWLVANQYDVRILFGDVKYDPPALKHIQRLLTDSLSAVDRRRVVDAPVSSAEELLAELAATDAVVATRFHNVLLALMLKKPVVSISFHHKCSSLMNQMGLSKYCQDIEHLDVSKLVEQFTDLEKSAQALSILIGQRVEELRMALCEQDSAIFKLLTLNGNVRNG